MRHTIKILLAAACIPFFIVSCTEKRVDPSDVPVPVTAAFNAKYPDAKHVRWEKEKEDNKTIYEAEFKTGDKSYETKFDENGKVLGEKGD